MESEFGGTYQRLAPADGLAADDRRVRGAQLQHLVADRVRAHLRGRVTPALFAKQQRMSLDRLYRVLRGESLMQIADLAAFAWEFEGVREKVIEFLSEERDPNAELPDEPLPPRPRITAEDLRDAFSHPDTGHIVRPKVG